MSVAQRFKDIANAIREKTGGVDPITPLQMPSVIRGIQTGLETMTEAAWEALSTAEKQTYNLIGIIQNESGYNRGIIVNGADTPVYEFEVLENVVNSTSANELTYDIEGGYNYLVILKQSKASSSNSFSYTASGLTPIAESTVDYGSFAMFKQNITNALTVKSYSTGNNWNNQCIFVAKYPDAIQSILKNYYDAYYPDSYRDTYEATEAESLYAFVSNGGSGSVAYTIESTGTIEIISEATGSGARVNRLYRITLTEGDTITFNFSGGNNSTDILYLLWK